MKKYIGAAISLGTISLLFYTIFDLREQVKQVEVLQFKLDSVIVLKDIQYDLNFQHEVEKGRYELGINYLESVNPKAADQLKTYIGHETE
jgi:hypothetical protein